MGARIQRAIDGAKQSGHVAALGLTTAVCKAALPLHVVQHHTRIVRPRHHLHHVSRRTSHASTFLKSKIYLRPIRAYSHTPYAKTIAQPHGNVLLDSSSDIAQMQRGINGRIYEIAPVACELNIGDGPLRPPGLHRLDWPKFTARSASKRQQRNAVKIIRVRCANDSQQLARALPVVLPRDCKCSAIARKSAAIQAGVQPGNCAAEMRWQQCDTGEQMLLTCLCFKCAAFYAC